VFQVEQYKNAVTNYNRTWRETDSTLYELCHRYPGHRDPSELYAKIFIIGRTYATGIERKIASKGTQAGAMCRLIQHMLVHTTELDAIFTPLTCLTETLAPDTLRTIIDYHGRFVRLLQPLTRNAHSTRSFCSKYMHFHCPAVPIVDSYVTASLRHMAPWRRSFKLFDLPEGSDEHYWRYVLRFWQLYQQADHAGVRPTVRLLDFYVLYVAEGAA